MEIQKLKYFYEVAKYSHVTKAAENLCIAQPALTQAIKLLERELGVPLFIKRGRNVVLTDYGEYLKKRLDVLLPEFNSIANDIDNMKQSVNKTVKLNILAASNFVIEAIVEYRKGNPYVIFDLEQNAFKQDCDIIVSTNGVTDKVSKNHSKCCVREEKIYLAVPKSSKYSKCKSIDLMSVKDEGFVMLSSSRLFGAVCNKFCSSAGFSPKILFESDSPEAVKNIVSTGTGIAFWPEFSWGKVKNKDVVLVNVENPICKREIIIELYERFPKPEYVEDFYEFLLKKFYA